jgi:hypothetical protein
MKILNFFYFVGNFCPPDPDPDPATQINADPDPEGADPQPCLDCLILLLQHLVLVGHSMGGAVAVAAAQLEAGIAGQISGIYILNSTVVDPASGSGFNGVPRSVSGSGFAIRIQEGEMTLKNRQK